MIICQHCKKQIESKNDLIVMAWWWLFPRPLHKSCWGDITMANKGIGSLSYQTGALQGKNRPHIAINSVFFTIISIALFLLGLYILFANFQSTITSGGQTVNATPAQTILVKLLFLVVLSIPLIQKIWVYTTIEKKIG